MNRKELRDSAAQEYIRRTLVDSPHIRTSAFKAGWDEADRTLIDKAVKWLYEHREEVQTEDNGIAGWIPDELIMDFKQAVVT